MNPLVKMQQLGQSPWHDNIRRDLLTSGRLKQMIDAGDITGLTSNPTIFEQAIGQTSLYDEAIAALSRQGKSAEEIFDALAIEDIRAAADLFRPVFDRTGGADGFVSIEVLPSLAHDTQGTLAEARRLWRVLDRPNLMVKIPATREGVPAIEAAIADGININVTLIFSLQRYGEVMDAYLGGLTRRHREGKPLGAIASVASFFVSRVDSAVDKLLEEKLAAGGDRARLEPLMGKAAIANAKLAYQAFKAKFAQPGFLELARAGARRQRPLWASTSTKNPRYPDVYYVEALIGPDTVDTMPPATVDAYRDHGKPQLTLEQDADGARRTLAALGEVGIDIDAVIHKLEVDGVASFTKSFDSLIAVVRKRRDAISGPRR